MKEDFNEKKNKFVDGEESANVYCLLQLGILFNSGKMLPVLLWKIILWWKCLPQSNASAKCKDLLVVWPVDVMASWWNDKLMKWLLDEISNLWNDKLMKWLVDEMTSWWNDK